MLNLEQLESRDCPAIAITAFDVAAGTATFTGDKPILGQTYSPNDTLILGEVLRDYGSGPMLYLTHNATAGGPHFTAGSYADNADFDSGPGVAHMVAGSGTAPMLTINLGTGTNVLKLDGTWDFAHPITYAGPWTNNIDLSVQSAGVAILVSSNRSGTISTLTFVNTRSITGTSGGDTLTMGPAAYLDAFVGGSGPNWLDYTAWTAPINVNLSTNGATQIGTLTGVHNVIGGSGNNVITGDAFNDILEGGNGGTNRLISGSGHSILIGGSGPCYIDSSIHNGSSIMIGGTTAYDGMSLAGRSALLADLAAWVSAPDIDVAIATINGGASPLDATSCFDNGVQDRLVGGSVSPNWFLRGTFDIIVNDTANDRTELI